VVTLGYTEAHSLKELVPLLPFQIYLASMLWPEKSLKEREDLYREFVSYTNQLAASQPSAQVVAGPISLVGLAVNLIIGVGFSLLSAALRPKPKVATNVQVQQSTQEVASIVSSGRFVPREGFDSVQQPAVLGDTIPLVVARREVLYPPSYPGGPSFTDGFRFGGTRIKLPLIWSQMWSYQSSLMLRAVFMLGQAPMERIEPLGFAIGDNTMSGYDLLGISPNANAARYSIYARLGGGRIKSSDHIAGKSASKDPGNLDDLNIGAGSVFEYRKHLDAGDPDEIDDFITEPGFCYTYKPTTTTVFGLYNWCSNGGGYRLRPNPRSTISCQTRADGSDTEFYCRDDPGVLADTWAAKYEWSRRGGITDISGSPDLDEDDDWDTVIVEPGQEITYKLYSTSDATGKIIFDSTNTDNLSDAPDSDRDCRDIGTAVAGGQHKIDDALVLGEIYKVGSALTILDRRQTIDADNERFISDADNEPPGGGRNVTYTFLVIRAGRVGLLRSSFINPSPRSVKPPQWDRNVELSTIDKDKRYFQVSAFPQIFRCAMGTVQLPRRGQMFEIGFKSTIGLKINGMPNWRTLPTLRKLNDLAGDDDVGIMDPADPPSSITYSVGQVSTFETRYSLWRLWYRKPEECFTAYKAVFAIRGNTSETIYNYLRVFMPEPDVGWILQFEPVSSWELRSKQYTNGLFIVLDDAEKPNTYKATGQFRIWFNGFTADLSNTEIPTLMRSKRLEPKTDLGYGFSGQTTAGVDETTMLDAYARCAEAFMYDEVQTTADNTPEHEIAYINSMQYNGTPATYEGIATVGINVLAGTEFNQFTQFSAYVHAGLRMYRHLEGDWGPSHLFPDYYRHKLLNPEYGTGQVADIDSIDEPSFAEAAQWCKDRFYFWDGASVKPENLDDWAADVAGTMLLSLFEKNGKMTFKPAVQFNTPIQATQLFTNSNMIPGTFSLSYLPLEDRLPRRAVVTYREERSPKQCLAGGFFAQDRTIILREVGTPDDAPLLDLPLSDYCTSRWHGIDAAAFNLRYRQLVDHTIAFDTTPAALLGGIAVNDYFQVGMDWSKYNAVANGIILNDGTLVTSKPQDMPAGSYPAVVWDGSTSPPYETNVVVAANGTATPVNHLFALQSTGTTLNMYKAEKVTMRRNGVISIQASHHPVNDEGIALLGINWPTYAADNSDPNWVYEEW
jgi:hypothetical protein